MTSNNNELIVQEIFVVDDHPEYTYVEREQGKNEGEIKFYLQKPTALVSISGPSKSGKSVLVDEVTSEIGYEPIEVHGMDINSGEDLWDEALDTLNAPTNTEITDIESDEKVVKGEGGVNAGPVNISGGGNKKTGEESGRQDSHARRGLLQVVEMVDTDRAVLFIDDAHYIDQDSHKEVSNQIKKAHREGLSVCLTYIPHRSKDLTQSNPELSGRVESIKIGYWDNEELEEIAKKGFAELNVSVPDFAIKNIAEEAGGSPHMMQKLCLEFCKEKSILRKITDSTKSIDITPSDLKDIFHDVAEGLGREYEEDYEIIVGNRSKGGGRERNTFELYDGKEGEEYDIYDVILRAITLTPVKSSFEKDEIYRRVERVCKDGRPNNLSQSLGQINEWMEDKSSDYKLDWLGDEGLEISDPYLIFYLRWSNKNHFEPELTELSD